MTAPVHYTRGTHPANRKKKGQLSHKNARCKTGCVGVSFTTRTICGHARRFFQVCLGPKSRRSFSVERLGLTEAFRRAVAARADYERAVAAAKQGALP